MSVSAKKGRNIVHYVRDNKPLTVDEVSTFPCVEVPQQDISQEEAEYFGIRSEFNQENGIEIVATYFPYHNQEGKLTSYKRRDWTKDKEEAGHFTVVGALKVSHQLFGQPQCKKNKKSSLIIVEGEGDVVATRRALLSALEGTKWEGKIHPNVVGLNCGAGNAQHSVIHNEEFIRSFNDVVGLTDSDSATEHERLKGVKKGREALEDIAAALLMPNFYTVVYPDKIKDPREWAKKDLKEFGKKIAWEKVKFTPEKVIDLSCIDVQQLRVKRKMGIPLKQFPKLSRDIKGLISGELITTVGPSGSGKSTVTRYMEKDIIDYLRHGLPDDIFDRNTTKIVDNKLRLDDYVEGEKIGIIRLEEDKEEVINSWYGMELGFNPKDFAVDPEKYITEEEHAKIHKQWQDEGLVHILDHFGSIPVDQLINKFKQLMAYGCRWFVLDHISMVISGLRVGDERKELDIVMTELAAFCKSYNVTILLVSHMSRIQFKPPVDRDSGEQLPFFYPVRKENLRGSAALEQISWTVIGVEPEELPNRSRGRVRLVSLKNRRGKKLGNTDTLWMEEETGKFIDASNWTVEGECYVCNSETMHCFSDKTIEPVLIPKAVLPQEKDEDIITQKLVQQELPQAKLTGLSEGDGEDIDEPF